MSAVTANFTVAPVNLSFVVDNNNINFTPNAISLGIFTGGQYPIASGLSANVANVHIFDGVNGYVLQTDGLGNLSWTAQTGNGGNGTPGGANAQVQFNDAGLFGGNTGFTFNKTTGVLTANGAGLTSIPGANVTGSVGNATNANAVAGANVSGAVTYASTANAVAGANVSGQVAVALVAGTVFTAAQPNITSVGTLTSLTISGNLTSNNANLGNLATANFFQGNGSLLTGLNVSGGTLIDNGTSNVAIPSANANVTIGVNGTSNVLVINNNGANLAGVLNATGNISGSRIISNIANGTAPFVVSSTTLVANLSVANSTFATSAGSANTATFATTANAVAGANVSGQVANALVAGTVYTNAQPNITSVGTLTDLRIANQNIHLGNNAGSANQGAYAIAIGEQAGNTNQGGSSIAIGVNTGNYQGVGAVAILGGGSSQGNNAIAILGAGNVGQGDRAIAIGYTAGTNLQGISGVAIGESAGYTNQGAGSVAIGNLAGNTNQSIQSVAIGKYSGYTNQGANAVAIGHYTGHLTQGANSVAIGANAGYQGQNAYSVAIGRWAGGANLAANSIAIGAYAAYPTGHGNTIVLNATGVNFSTTQADSFFVNPIRNVTGNASFSVTLYYNPTTGEVGYK